MKRKTINLVVMISTLIWSISTTIFASENSYGGIAGAGAEYSGAANNSY